MEPGTLYIVATPIGNLEDITLRALRILGEADLVYCEDTRQTRKLVEHHGIKALLKPLHAHSPEPVIRGVVAQLLDGKTIAYCSDAGTPGISDPGGKLVALAREGGASVVPVPGPSALATMLSVAGFPPRDVIFAGFASRKEGRRRNELTRYREFPGLIVLYESPHRIKKLLTAIHEVFPGQRILVGREMTKFHEEFIAGTTDEIMAGIDDLMVKGEFTVAIFND